MEPCIYLRGKELELGLGNRQRLLTLADNENDWTSFFTRQRVNFCKCLIEHPKLYRFFTTFVFFGW